MIRDFGESAFLVEVGGSERAQALAVSLDAQPIDGVTEVVPGLDSLLVELDPSAADDVMVALRERITSMGDATTPARPRRIPVVYGGEHGPDLGAVAAQCGLTEEEVIERHAAAELRVLFDGFAPGFAYLGDLSPQLRVPRLATPRTHTPPGSVAIAGAMSGIYPADLPGGWPVIGRTPVVLFDPRREPPAYLAPGDRVTFVPIGAADWPEDVGPAGDW